MRSTGIVRRVDELGRIVLPIEMRRVHGIVARDPVEIYTDDDKIVLRKYEPACVFCGNADGVDKFRGKNVCRDCLALIAKEVPAARA